MKLQSLASAMILTFGGLFLTQTYADAIDDIKNNKLRPDSKQIRVTKDVTSFLNNSHYLQTPLDEKKSPEILNMYLETLDPNRTIFLQSDIDIFEEKYKTRLSTMLRRGNLSAAFGIYKIYQQRMTEYYQFTNEFVKQEHDLNTDETINVDREEAPYFTTKEEQKDYWKKRLILRLINITINQMEEKAKEDALRANPELAKGQDLIRNDKRTPIEILEKRLKRQQGQFSRTKSDTVLEGILNAALGSYDPHSSYYAPVKATEVNIQSNLSLEGIGVSIRPDRKNSDYTSIVRVVEGGPASKTGQVKAGEFIVGVSKPDGSMVNVVGWSVREIVGLIRGKKGTKVTIKLMKPGTDESSARSVTIVRDLIEQEEQGVQTRVFNLDFDGLEKKIGVLEIPSFYFDFRAYQKGDKYRSVSIDTAKALRELNAKGIDGLVVDLRNNPGGSLSEVHSMLGDFIEEGPVVQIKDSRERVEVLEDSDGGKKLFDKPMVVLINLASASASEIFAAAIQDYNRGLIIGSTTTGKGSAQVKRDGLVHGQMTLTQKKFYRVTGGSTQNKGVIPDIELVNIYDEDLGERASKHALEWDTIKTAPFKPEASYQKLLPELRKRSNMRLQHNPQFVYLQSYRDLRDEQEEDDKVIDLNLQKRLQEIQATEDKTLKIENTRREAEGKEPYANWDIYQAAIDARTEKRSNMKSNERPKLPEDEVFVIEAATIMLDQLKMQKQQ